MHQPGQQPGQLKALQMQASQLQPQLQVYYSKNAILNKTAT